MVVGSRAKGYWQHSTSHAYEDNSEEEDTTCAKKVMTVVENAAKDGEFTQEWSKGRRSRYGQKAKEENAGGKGQGPDGADDFAFAL